MCGNGEYVGTLISTPLGCEPKSSLKIKPIKIVIL